MTQGWCLKGNEVTGQNNAPYVAMFFTSEPQITYHSNGADEAFWGFTYTSFNNGPSFVDGSYEIFQCDQSECSLTPPTYDCVNGSCTQNSSGTGAYSSLSACQSNCAWYDCLNGGCVQNTTYNTPGNYKSLSACTAACSSTCCPAGQSCFDPNDLPCPAPLAQHVPVARLAQPALLAPTAFAVIAQVVPIQMAIVQLAQLAHKWRHLAPVGNHAKYTQVKM